MVSWTNLPYLQSPCAKDASPLVFCQVPGGDSDLVRLTLALLLCGCGGGLTVCHLLVTTNIIVGFVWLVGVTFLIQSSLFTIRVVVCQEVVSVILFFAQMIKWVDA